MKVDSPLVASLLWLGDEDYTGLWEAVAEVRAHRSGSTPAEVRTATAELILALANSGMIEIFACREPVEDETASRLSRPQYEESLAQESRWNPLPIRELASGVDSIRYATTDLGLAAYQDFYGRGSRCSDGAQVQCVPDDAV
jgi:hypothetical protein